MGWLFKGTLERIGPLTFDLFGWRSVLFFYGQGADYLSITVFTFLRHVATLNGIRFTDFWVFQRTIRENKRTSNVLVNLLLKPQAATQTCGYPNTGWRISTCPESDVNSSPLLEDPFKMQSKSNKKHISYIINTIFISSSPIHQKAQVLFTVFFFCFSIKVK